MTTRLPTMCDVCRFRHPFDPDVGVTTCDAYPDGVPGEIRYGDADHRSALPGDNGVRFEPAPNAHPGTVERALARFRAQ